MKLHLPPGLHAALIIGFAAATTIGSTYATGALTDGTFEAAFNSLVSAITPNSPVAEFDGDIAPEPEPEPLIKDFPQGGTISNRDYADYQQLTVSGGTLQVDYSSESGEGFTSGEVAVGGGANLLLNGQNALGYGEGKVSKLSLAGESTEAMASVGVANRNSLASPFSMSGYSSVAPTTEAGVLEIPEAEDINVTGAKNHIATDIALSAPLSVTVTKDDAGQGDLTISGKITAAAETAGMNIAGDGELTLSGADSTLGAVTNNGNLVIGASMSTSAYDAFGTGSLKVANGAVFTIDSLSNTETGHAWKVITAWDADAGDTGLVVIKGGFDSDTDMYDTELPETYQINGRYQIQGNMDVDPWYGHGSYMSQTFLNISIEQDAYLSVTGNVNLDACTQFRVYNGTLEVGETLSLAKALSGSVLIEGEDARVSAKGVYLGAYYGSLTMHGGTLSIGGAGVRTEPNSTGELKLLGGTLVTGEGWSADAGVSVTLGAVTMGAASTGAAVFEGDITFTDTVINRNGIVNDEATQGLVLRDSTLTVRVQDLINLDADLENGLDSDTNGLITQRYWLVRNEGENAKLTLADGAVAVVGEHQYTLDADGSFVATNHQTYALNVGSEQYSAIRDIGAGIIRLNDGVTLNVDADAVELSLSLAGSAVISTDRDTHISGHILHSSASDLDKNLTLNLTDTAVFSGNINLDDGAGVLTVNSGELLFGKPLSTNQSNAVNVLQASEIVVESGARFSIYHAGDKEGFRTFLGADGTATDVTLNGGTLYVQSMDGEPEVTRTALGTLTVNGDSALDAMYCGHLAFDALSGSGKLTVATSINSGYGRFWATFGTLRDFNGELVTVDKTSVLGVSKVYLNSAHQSGTNAATITGKSYSEGDFVMSGTGSLTLGDHESAGSFDVQGGKVTMTGDVVLNEGAGTLSISNGEVHFGNPLSTNTDSATNTLRASEIVIGTGGKLTFYHACDAAETPVFQGVDGAATNLTLNGGTFYVQSMGDDPDKASVAFGSLTVNGDSALDGRYRGHVTVDSLSGSGKLTLGGSADGNYGRFWVTVDSLTDFNGELVTVNKTSQLGVSKVYLNSAHQSGTNAATITGKSYSEGDFVMSGTGSLTLGDHESAGSFDVQGGKVTMVGDVVLNEGAGTLSVSNGEVHFGNPLSSDNVNATNTLKAAEISIGSDGKLTFYHSGDATGAPVFQGADGAATNLTLDDGTFFMQAMGGSATVAMGILTVSGESALDGKYNGHMDFASLTGSGKLTIADSVDATWGRYTTSFASLNNFDGELVVKDAKPMATSVTGYTRTSISNVHLDKELETTITGKTYSEGNLSKTGEGSLVLGAHESTGSFDVQGGTVTMTGDVSLHGGSGKLTIDAGSVCAHAGTTLSAGEIIVEDGATFSLEGSAQASAFSAVKADGKATDVTLNGGTLAKLGEDAAQATFGVLTTSDGSAVSMENAGSLEVGVLTGSGTLTITQNASGTSTFTVAYLEDYDGKIVLAGTNDTARTYINGVDQGRNSSVVIETQGELGTYSADGFVKAGAGSMTVGRHMAEGSFTIERGAVTVTDALDVSGATVLDGGSLTIAQGAIVSLAALEIKDGELHLNSSVAAKDGFSLTQTGGTLNVEVSALQGLEHTGLAASEYSSNGWGATRYTLISGTNLNIGNGAQVMVDGTAYDLAADGTFNCALEGERYYIVTKDEVYQGPGNSGIGSAKEIVLKGKGLNLSGNLGDSTSIVVEKSGVVDVGSSTTLVDTQVMIDAGTMLNLHGKGVYQVTQLERFTLGSTEQTGKSVLYFAGWEGTVLMDGLELSGQNLSNYATSSSAVELRDVEGWLAAGTHTPTVILSGQNTMTASEGAVTFAGAVRGTGSLEHAVEGASDAAYAFSGKVTDWTGDFRIVEGAGAAQLSFTGEAKVINANISGGSTEDSRLSMEVANDAAVEVNGALTGNMDVTYSGAGTKTVGNASSDYTGSTDITGGEVVVADAAAFGQSAVSVTAGALKVGDFSLDNTVTAGAATIAKLAEAAVDYSQVQVTAEALSSMKDGAALSNAHISVAKGGAYAINNVELSNTKLAVAGALTMDASSLEGAMLAENVEINVEATGSIATLNGQVGVFGGEHSVTLGELTDDGMEGDYTMRSSSQLSGLVLAGEACFKVDLSSVADSLAEDPYIGLVFSGLSVLGDTASPLAEGDALLTDSLGKYFTLTGADGYRLSKVESDGENTVLYVVNAAAVPEPTTATLSLLALSMLAARRRRK